MSDTRRCIYCLETKAAAVFDREHVIPQAFGTFDSDTPVLDCVCKECNGALGRELDGRLPLDNTRSERSLRKIVVGRKNWMCYGSDAHAESAAAIFSLIASCRLHRIDPQLYLDEVMRVLPYWPQARYLELAPKYWTATRSNLNPVELEADLCSFTVPPVALNFAR